MDSSSPACISCTQMHSNASLDVSHLLDGKLWSWELGYLLTKVAKFNIFIFENPLSLQHISYNKMTCT